MRKIIPVILLFVLLFYHLFPQGLSLFGFSFIFTSGLVGLIVCFFNRNFWPEMWKAFLAYIPITLMCYITRLLNGNYYDPFWMDTTKSIVGWFFSAYLVIFLFYKIHPKGSIYLLFYYLIAAIIAQGIISIAMHMNSEIDKFFSDIMMMDELAKMKRDETRGERLLGYGIAFFGAGIIAGVGLTLVVFVLMTQKMNQLQRILLSLCYAFIFYVGLLSARTTLAGAGISLVLLAFLIVSSKNRTINNAQLVSWFGVIFVILIIGQTLCYLYFPQFADWAFEAFTNYEETGEWRTESSDGIYNMFIFPNTFSIWLYGHAHMLFWGTDVGYTRLLFYFGIPGTLAYFYYQWRVMGMSLTKYMALNYTLYALGVLVLVLNVKGLADINSFLFVIFFFVIYRKYEIIIPEQKKLNAIRRRNQYYASLQSKESIRRL